MIWSLRFVETKNYPPATRYVRMDAVTKKNLQLPEDIKSEKCGQW